MEEFCPLCNERGLKSKMKAFQINLEEAVWLCESEKCTWPMGCQELEYIPRKLGETWSCYWHKYKPIRPTVNEFQPGWPAFFTPPYTPRTEVSPAASSDTSTHSHNGINPLYNAYSKESIDSCSSKDAITSNSTMVHTDVEENNALVLENSISDLLSTHNDVSKAEDLNQFSLDRLETSSLTSTKLQTETAVNVQRNLDSVKLTVNSKSFDTGVPIIVKIEEGRLVNIKSINKNRQLPQNESSLKNKSQIVPEISNTSLTKQIPSENSLQTSSTQISGLLTKKDDLPANKSIKIDDKISNSLVKIETVNIQGLPSVTLRYEVPTFLQETISVETVNREEEKLNPKLVVPKKSALNGKMYEKFSFSELRKSKNLKKEECQVSNSNKKMLEIKSSSTNQILPDTAKSVVDPSNDTDGFKPTDDTNDDRNMFFDSDNSKDNQLNVLDVSQIDWLSGFDENFFSIQSS